MSKSPDTSNALAVILAGVKMAELAKKKNEEGFKDFLRNYMFENIFCQSYEGNLQKVNKGHLAAFFQMICGLSDTNVIYWFGETLLECQMCRDQNEAMAQLCIDSMLNIQTEYTTKSMQAELERAEYIIKGLVETEFSRKVSTLFPAKGNGIPPYKGPQQYVQQPMQSPQMYAQPQYVQQPMQGQPQYAQQALPGQPQYVQPPVPTQSIFAPFGGSLVQASKYRKGGAGQDMACFNQDDTLVPFGRGEELVFTHGEKKQLVEYISGICQTVTDLKAAQNATAGKVDQALAETDNLKTMRVQDIEEKKQRKLEKVEEAKIAAKEKATRKAKEAKEAAKKETEKAAADKKRQEADKKETKSMLASFHSTLQSSMATMMQQALQAALAGQAGAGAAAGAGAGPDETSDETPDEPPTKGKKGGKGKGKGN